VDMSGVDVNPTQYRFMNCRDRVTAFLGGYGAGKSWVLARVALFLAAENAGLDGLIVAPTWGILQKTTLRGFYDEEAPDEGACPPELIARHDKGERYIQLVNGSRVYYGSADRPGSLEGANLAWWALDEPRLVKKQAWRVLIGRLRHSKATRLQGVIAGTPAAGWLQEEFGAEKKERRAFHASTRENARHLAEGYIEDLENTYSRRQAEVLIEGRFGLLEGSVYEEFSQDYHTVDWTFRPELPVTSVIDFGRRESAVTCWQSVIPGTNFGPARYGKELKQRKWVPGARVCFAEFMLDNHTTQMLGRKLKAAPFQTTTIICDPAGNSGNIVTGLSDVEAIRAEGLPSPLFTTNDRLRHIPFGIQLVSGSLMSVSGGTKLWISKALDNPKARRGLLKDFASYHYEDAKDGKAPSDKPVHDSTSHSMDTVRYLEIHEYAQSSGGFGVVAIH
jgi:hypothetical protein